MAVKFEQTALRAPTVSRSFSRFVMDIAVFFLASGTVFAKDDGGDFCTQTTRAAFNACQYEAADDFWIAKGNCHNRSDPHARAECEEKTIVARRTKLQECRVRRQGRSGVCQALGEAPYDPLIDLAMFVDPSQIGKAIAPNPYFLLVPGRTMVYKSNTKRSALPSLEKLA